MKIKLNSISTQVDKVRNAIKNNGGYCPCQVLKNEDTKCICKSFKEQTTEGQCYCGLYVKFKEKV